MPSSRKTVWYGRVKEMPAPEVTPAGVKIYAALAHEPGREVVISLSNVQAAKLLIAAAQQWLDELPGPRDPNGPRW